MLHPRSRAPSGGGHNLFPFFVVMTTTMMNGLLQTYGEYMLTGVYQEAGQPGKV